MDHKALRDNDCICCTSCGTTLAGWNSNIRIWGHSHNLPKGRFPEFEVIPANISPRCQNFGTHKGCHDALDDGDFAAISQFGDLKQLMQFRRSNAPVEYNLFVTGLESVGCFEFKRIEL